MHLTDPIYGSVDITEPVLVELLESAPVQRLKGIDQHGPLKYSQPERQTITRYDHSVGVMLLLRRFGASVEEQAAGLLHDVAHTAFSHVADIVFGRDAGQDFHEYRKQRFIGDTSIPQLLQHHGFDPRRVVDAANYSLLEQTDEADLCADRIDYSLRDATISWPIITPGDAQDFLDALQVENGHWLLADQSSAKRYGNHFLDIVQRGYYTPINAAAFHTFSEALKLGLERDIITEEDFFNTDLHLYGKLEQAGDPEVTKMLRRLGSLQVKFDENAFTLRRFPKLRWSDPSFRDERGVHRVSEVDPEFAARLNAHLEWMRRGLPLRYL